MSSSTGYWSKKKVRLTTPTGGSKPVEVRRHDLVPSKPTGAGEAASTAVGRKNRVDKMWDMSVEGPKAGPPVTRSGVLSDAKTAMALEIRIAKNLSQMRSKLESLCQDAGLKGRLRALTFERWRFSANQEAATAGEDAASGSTSVGKKKKKLVKTHPVFPEGKEAPQSSIDDLAKDLEMQGLSSDAASSVAKKFGEVAMSIAAAACDERWKALSGKKYKAAGALTISFHKHSIDIACGSNFVKLTRPAYGKLAVLYRIASSRLGGEEKMSGPPTPQGEDEAVAEAERLCSTTESDSDASEGPLGEFHTRLFTLLLRYKSLQGHGFQAALGPKVWECLQSSIGVSFECFASPLNCYLPHYGSGFSDVDGPFGSSGSFYDLKFGQGSFACNPPFVTPLMDASADHILSLLKAAEHKKLPLSFAVFVPGWKEGRGYRAMCASSMLRRQVHIDASDHGFCDGASHQRKDPFRASPYATTCFILQTTRASTKWPANDSFEKDLRKAMALTVPLKSASARQEKRSHSKRKRKVKKTEKKADKKTDK